MITRREQGEAIGVLSRYRELAKDLWTRPRPPRETSTHLRAALEWIYRAQDAGTDRGVSHSYVIGRGWLPSYAETTGYIIPTLLNWWHVYGDEEARRRALEMADWETDVQLEDGGVGSLASPGPVVFNTGQVLFGWIAAFEATGDERYRSAAIRAADWLLAVQDEDGGWSRHCGASGIPATYNARVAWPLIELARHADGGRYRDRASAFLDWGLAHERAPGWFANNCLNDPERPLLHTIAYTAEAFLEAGLLLGERRFVDAARRTSTALLPLVGEDGRLPGRFDAAWRPAARWACLTGMAQMSVIWHRLAAVGEGEHFLDAKRKVDRFLLSVHDVDSADGGLRGGVRGSYPVNGAYCRYRAPNWATKFFVDAILCSLPDFAERRFKG